MSIKFTEKLINIKAKLFQEIQIVCKNLLKTHSLAKQTRQYLQTRVSQKNQDAFDFGYFPDDDHLEILFDNIAEKKVKALDLVYPYNVQNGDYRVYVNKGMLSSHNLTMPYRDVYGNIKALVGRTILSEEERKEHQLQKYKYTKFNKSLHLFGLYQAKNHIVKKNSVFIVEGQIDCITCHEYGIHNVVALGGASLNKRQFHLLNRFTNKFYLLLDNDLEGKKAQNRIIKQYSKSAIIEILELPTQYKDVDEYLHNHKQSYIFDSL